MNSTLSKQKHLMIEEALNNNTSRNSPTFLEVLSIITPPGTVLLLLEEVSHKTNLITPLREENTNTSRQINSNSSQKQLPSDQATLPIAHQGLRAVVAERSSSEEEEAQRWRKL
jgi:hypothetical protein